MLSLPDHRSTRPYLIRAMFEWSLDQGLTPYLVVMVDRSVLVPQEFVKNGEIVLNISPEATGNLSLGNDWIEFKARFGGVAKDILVPVERVIAIYAKENGQGMAFPKPLEGDKTPSTKVPSFAGAAPTKSDKSPWLQVVPSKALAQEPGGAMMASGSLSSSGAIEAEKNLDSLGLDESGAQESGHSHDEPPRPPGGGESKSHLKRIK